MRQFATRDQVVIAMKVWAQVRPRRVGEAGRPDVSHWANGFAAQRPSIARLRDRLWCGSPD